MERAQPWQGGGAGPTGRDGGSRGRAGSSGRLRHTAEHTRPAAGVEEGEFGSAAATDALPFLGKFRRRFTFCPNPKQPEPDAPALLLVGFNGATQRILDGYLRWHFEAGFGCALVLRPTAYHTYAGEPHKQIAPALLRYVEWAKTKRGARRVVLHFFSGSVYLYIRMLKVLREDREEDVGQGDHGLPVAGQRFAHIAPLIDGVIFDSTPIENAARNGANAMANVSGVPALGYPLYWAALAAYWYLLWGYLYPAQDRCADLSCTRACLSLCPLSPSLAAACTADPTHADGSLSAATSTTACGVTTSATPRSAPLCSSSSARMITSRLTLSLRSSSAGEPRPPEAWCRPRPCAPVCPS